MEITISSHSHIILEILTAMGPIILGIVAIWNRQVRSFFVRPRLLIELHNVEGDPTSIAGHDYVYYHLKVTNKRPWLPITKCRVLLKGCAKLNSDGSFTKLPMPVPFQFCWAPLDKFRLVTITKEKVFDFFRLSITRHLAKPLLYETPNNFKGYLNDGETIRYELEVTSGNSYGNRTQMFEVQWVGAWTKNPEEAKRLLRIREVYDYKV